MICHSHEEIDILYAEKPDLADKLHKCFDNLVRTENIYQEDLIGIGGDKSTKITYAVKPILINFIY